MPFAGLSCGSRWHNVSLRALTDPHGEVSARKARHPQDLIVHGAVLAEHCARVRAGPVGRTALQKLCAQVEEALVTQLQAAVWSPR